MMLQAFVILGKIAGQFETPARLYIKIFKNSARG